MDVFINGEQGEPSIAGDVTLGSVIDGLRDRLIREQGLAIVSVSLDGTVLDRAAQVARGSEKTAAFKSLEIKTIEPIGFSLQTLGELKKNFLNINSFHSQAIEVLRSSGLESALPLLVACSQLWRVLFQAVSFISSLTPISMGDLKVGDAPVEGALQGLINELNKFQKACDERDVITVGDLVQYELEPRVEPWKTFLEDLSSLLNEGRESG